MMTSKYLLAVLTALAVIAILTADASAMYDAPTGRWLQRDPAEDVNRIDLYEYAHSTPLKEIDYLGLEAYVLVYGNYDPMFKAWAESAKTRIESNQSTYYGDNSKKYNPANDKIYMIELSAADGLDKLDGIADIAYFASFGHGQDAKVWWDYKTADGTKKTIASGIPGYRLNSRPEDVKQVELTRLANLKYTACPLIEFYHCTTAKWWTVNEGGTPLFADEKTTTPMEPKGDAKKQSVISYFKQLLETAHKGRGMTYRVYGAEQGINNGWPWSRGWPRPSGVHKKTAVIP